MLLVESKAFWERIQFDNSALVSEARISAEQLYQKMIERTDHALTLTLQQRQLEELKAIKIVGGIEGKNEAERNARMTLALMTDADASKLISDIELTRHDLADLDAQIELLRNRLSLLKSQIRWNIASAAAWGGPDDV